MTRMAFLLAAMISSFVFFCFSLFFWIKWELLRFRFLRVFFVPPSFESVFVPLFLVPRLFWVFRATSLWSVQWWLTFPSKLIPFSSLRFRSVPLSFSVFRFPSVCLSFFLEFCSLTNRFVSIPTAFLSQLQLWHKRPFCSSVWRRRCLRGLPRQPCSEFYFYSWVFLSKCLRLEGSFSFLLRAWASVLSWPSQVRVCVPFLLPPSFFRVLPPL